MQSLDSETDPLLSNLLYQLVLRSQQAATQSDPHTEAFLIGEVNRLRSLILAIYGIRPATQTANAANDNDEYTGD